MSMSKGGFERKSKTSDEIPSSSLADIAFLLLIFFMVTTVFRTDSERDIQWPAAAATKKIDEKKKDIMYVWLERNGDVWINDRLVAMTDVSQIVAPLYLASQQRMVISMRADSDVPYRYTDGLMKELQRAGAVRVVFATELERRMTTERR
jgi:biopolymer transport protein ExbD